MTKGTTAHSIVESDLPAIFLASPLCLNRLSPFFPFHSPYFLIFFPFLLFSFLFFFSAAENRKDIMASSDPLGPQQGGPSESVASSGAVARSRRNDGRYPITCGALDRSVGLTRSESWVEIASQPSSSSLSSIGDEIVTTGLRVGHSSYPRGRRRLHPQQQQQHIPSPFMMNRAATNTGTSSQEEYDETESEEDRLMTSSAEIPHPATSLRHQQTAIRSGINTDSEGDDDDDENATALGRPSNSPTFRPQPNAFSHPPSHLSHRHSTSSAPLSHQAHHHRPSFSTRSTSRPHRGAPNFMSPSYQADNDAALRASLTTLLSCAAAVGGLPKKDHVLASPSVGVGIVPSSQPMELRLVPESELMAENRAAPPARGPRMPDPKRAASNSSAASAPASASSHEREVAAVAEKGKRVAHAQAKPPRATKKKRTGTMEGEAATLISPTLLTWVVSAGVVVLVSVVGFGAGYVIGREVGRQEGALGVGMGSASTNSSAASCGGELVRSTGTGTLRRFRWASVKSAVA